MSEELKLPVDPVRLAKSVLGTEVHVADPGNVLPPPAACAPCRYYGPGEGCFNPRVAQDNRIGLLARLAFEDCKGTWFEGRAAIEASRLAGGQDAPNKAGICLNAKS